MARWPVLAAFCVFAASCALGGLHSSLPERVRADPNWIVVPDVRLIHQRGRSDCGMAALSTVIKYWRPTTSEDEVLRALGPIDDRRGIEAGRLRSVAQAHGLKAYLVEGTVDDLAHEVGQRRPVIVGLVAVEPGHAFGHYEVVVGMNTRRKVFLMADPRGAWREMGIDELLSQWRPSRQLALVILP